jgi:hypothetical protein
VLSSIGDGVNLAQRIMCRVVRGVSKSYLDFGINYRTVEA